jgi:hypothetical protein
MKNFEILANGYLRSAKAPAQFRHKYAALQAQSFQDRPSTFFD